jgi:hypothetical protein
MIFWALDPEPEAKMAIRFFKIVVFNKDIVLAVLRKLFVDLGSKYQVAGIKYQVAGSK